jgi:hypothetical protein
MGRTLGKEEEGGMDSFSPEWLSARATPAIYLESAAWKNPDGKRCAIHQAADSLRRAQEGTARMSGTIEIGQCKRHQCDRVRTTVGVSSIGQWTTGKFTGRDGPNEKRY